MTSEDYPIIGLFVNEEHRDIYNRFMQIAGRVQLEQLYEIQFLIETPEAYFALLRQAYEMAEEPWRHCQPELNLLDELFHPDGIWPWRYDCMMERAEREVFAALPERMTVYRGVTDPSHLCWSWTRDRKVAEWFAVRWSDGYVVTGHLRKRDAIAYLNGRNEHEIIADPNDVKIVRVKPHGRNPSQTVSIGSIAKAIAA